MKALLTCLLILCSLTHLSFAERRLGVGESEPMPVAGFKDFAELEKWASSSSFGGGYAVRLNLDGIEVFYSMRVVTWGRATAELYFFVRLKGGLSPVVKIPMQFAQYQVDVVKDEIVVKRAAEKGWVTAMRIGTGMLPPGSLKTEQGDAVQPATAKKSKSEGKEKTKPESEGRSQ